ncbi:VPLPA-CTERM sorting domain-containing protein [Rhodovulum sp. P5]|uniref:VPLPA-CTERM sorting domain-containing protein n=1 Tax=Rhodovulum sp. P5 TaxID=1564506 RepID=UPI0020A32164|nr:VPLPA-CTERM sorting domain-containing protein [Rhodovulum sp. P5]
MTLSAKSLLLAAGLLVPFGASAATISIIDNFDGTSQRVSANPSPGLVSSSEVADGTVIGGYRDMYVTTTPPSLDTTDLRVEGGYASFSNNTFTSGLGVLVYDGLDSDAVGVNTTGLGGIDLLAGNSLSDTYFFFNVVAADDVADVTITVYDMVGGVSTYTETLAPGFDPYLYFDLFTGTADFSNVGALVFEIESINTAFDGALDSITVESVPLPASALLLAGALGGLGLARSRRKS